MKRKLMTRFFVGYGVTFLVVILGLLISYQTNAQSSKPAAGIKGGLNVSNLYTGDVDDRDARYGFNVGIFGQPASSDVAALQLELNYSTKGTMVMSSFGTIDQETKFRMNYLDLPVLAVFKLGKAVELHAGAYAAYLLSANIDSDGDLGDTFDEVDKDNFNSFDYGVAAGIGFNLGGIQIGGRYNLGLNEIARSSAAKNIFGSAKNQFGQLYIAFNLNHDSTVDQ